MTYSITPILAALGLMVTVGQAQAAQQTAYLAGGCFWCVEADFEKVRGVGDVVSGFAGGDTANPTYGNSGDHLEAVRVPFDDTQISYRQIYDMFLRSIDPLDAGGQFCDRGLEYTTAILYETDAQRQAAEAAVADAEAALGQDIVTKTIPVNEFSPVDAYHQDYYKSQDRVAFTRFGVAVPKNEAYVRYRQGCGRDARVQQVWGDAAPFVK